ncbi:hypothetical protein IKF23_00960 [Candidatus Saccharibacteria bacterium]|nr:hypothetical protein [Candidatus Saccharibacteria bacterium]
MNTMDILKCAVFGVPFLIGIPWSLGLVTVLKNMEQEPLNGGKVVLYIVAIFYPFVIQLILCSIFLESLLAGFALACWTQVCTATSAAATVGIYGIVTKNF